MSFHKDYWLFNGLGCSIKDDPNLSPLTQISLLLAFSRCTEFTNQRQPTAPSQNRRCSESILNMEDLREEMSQKEQRKRNGIPREEMNQTMDKYANHMEDLREEMEM
jgi:hypothetical protein